MAMYTEIDVVDEERIRTAVQRAEERTAGEIVPVVVPQSDSYEVARWRGGIMLGLFSLLGILLFQLVYEGWSLFWLYTVWGVVFCSVAGGILGALLVNYVAPLQRLFAGRDLLDETVHRRALQSFLEEEVFDTRDRTGILLFVSLREHRIEVLGDVGIDAHVRPDDWAEVVARIRTGIRNDSLTEGLVEAIEMCGRLLERRGVNIRPDDENELRDALRTPEPSEGASGQDRGADDGTEGE